MQRNSGLSWAALERSYIAETNPQRLERGTRKPDAFLRYVKGKQVPRERGSKDSPVRWALDRHPAFVRAYQSPLFELLQLDNDRDRLIEFSRDLLDRRRVADDVIYRTMRKSSLGVKKRLYVPLWSNPEEVVALRNVIEPDALCLILIALKAKANRAHEHHCLAICAEWLQAWAEQVRPYEDLVDLMLRVLAEGVPACAPLLGYDGKWRTLRVDSSDPCFHPSP